MRIAIVTNWVPFLRGGAERLADGLLENLRARGHEAVLVKLPFRWQPPEKVVEHMLACRAVRIRNADRIIGLKFPAYYVPHPDKTLWLVHQFRQAYDLWGTPHQDLPATHEGLRIRDVVRASDSRFLRECRRTYAISPVVSERLRRFNGIDAETLYPPFADASGFVCESYGDTVFCPGRITAVKRQHLAVEAMRYVETPVRLIVAGEPETPEDLARIEAAAAGLEDRVRIIPRFITEREKRDLYANALACACVPYDEDFGYVTLEAYLSRKPVLTCTDSGGAAMLVPGALPADARALAAAMDALYNDRRRARELGEAGYEAVRALDLSWDNVVARLMAR
ncbi:MAG: glycosyltransferase family 4 protein [Acidobacteriota bacterium]